jgi:hypothetical protein
VCVSSSIFLLLDDCVGVVPNSNDLLKEFRAKLCATKGCVDFFPTLVYSHDSTNGFWSS